MSLLVSAKMFAQETTEKQSMQPVHESQAPQNFPARPNMQQLLQIIHLQSDLGDLTWVQRRSILGAASSQTSASVALVVAFGHASCPGQGFRTA